jgi:hypothetical protein
MRCLPAARHGGHARFNRGDDVNEAVLEAWIEIADKLIAMERPGREHGRRRGPGSLPRAEPAAGGMKGVRPTSPQAQRGRRSIGTSVGDGLEPL